MTPTTRLVLIRIPASMTLYVTLRTGARQAGALSRSDASPLIAAVCALHGADVELKLVGAAALEIF